MSKFVDFLRVLLPVRFASKAEQVAPVIRAEIDKIKRVAQQQVDELLARHSAQTVETGSADELARAKAAYDRLVVLINADAARKLGETKLVLPSVASQLSPASVTPAS